MQDFGPRGVDCRVFGFPGAKRPRRFEGKLFLTTKELHIFAYFSAREGVVQLQGFGLGGGGVIA